MPYAIGHRGEKWVVYNPDSGKVYGEHDSEESAKSQQAAMYANAPPGDEKKKAEVTWWPR